jgi:hypothetical protein
MTARMLLRFLFITTATSCAAWGSPDNDPWKPYDFLIGQWAGEGSGEPGKGSGEFSFAWDLQKKVLVRKSRTDFPASAGRPAFSHEDLMVVYQGDHNGPRRAIYFDSEGHVINYVATVSDDKQTLTFLSEAAAAVPRFRLTYSKEKEDTVRIKFEMALPGKPDDFKTYLEGSAHRQNRPKPGESTK